MGIHSLEKIASEVVAVNNKVKDNLREIEYSIKHGYAGNSSAQDVAQLSKALKSLNIAFKEFNESRKRFKDLRKAYKKATKL